MAVQRTVPSRRVSTPRGCRYAVVERLQLCLLDRLLLGTSENTYSTQYGAYCRQQQAHVQEGGSMPTRAKPLLTALRCQKHAHPFKAELCQRLHSVAPSNEIVGKTT